MTRVFYLLVAGLLFMSSCKRNDDKAIMPDPDYRDAFVGTYDCKKIHIAPKMDSTGIFISDTTIVNPFVVSLKKGSASNTVRLDDFGPDKDVFIDPNGNLSLENFMTISHLEGIVTQDSIYCYVHAAWSGGIFWYTDIIEGKRQ